MVWPQRGQGGMSNSVPCQAKRAPQRRQTARKLAVVVIVAPSIVHCQLSLSVTFAEAIDHGRLTIDTCWKWPGGGGGSRRAGSRPGRREKPEIRSSKSETISKSQFKIRNAAFLGPFELCICFGFRASDFGLESIH